VTVEEAAALLRAGKLVAFPTETVYGLGANALDEAAVARIFEVKGRPSTSPLIVHVDSIAMARELAAPWPEAAETLAQRYWPGPLTLVVPKHPRVPDIVTAGLDTVGLRMPAHPMALELIRAAGVPVAAPSANRFTELSPTTAEHVRQSLGDRLECVLDGGPTEVGIESMVLSLAVDPPMLLRAGIIPLPEIEALIGPVALAPAPATPATPAAPAAPAEPAAPAGAAHPSPGMHPRHYRPRTPLYLLEPGQPAPPTGRGAWLRPGHEMPAEARAYAAALYETLHRLDKQALDWIAVERPPATPEWEGVLDRLRRAAE
jgi:L-threonylcarbamoyladenylate synthase